MTYTTYTGGQVSEGHMATAFLPGGRIKAASSGSKELGIYGPLNMEDYIAMESYINLLQRRARLFPDILFRKDLRWCLTAKSVVCADGGRVRLEVDLEDLSAQDVNGTYTAKLDGRMQTTGHLSDVHIHRIRNMSESPLLTDFLERIIGDGELKMSEYWD